MSIHPNSVFSKKIKDFDIDFYKSLTDKENFCYVNSTRQHASFDNYEPFFEALNQAILSYLNANRDIKKWYSLTNSIYVYDYLREKIKGEIVSEEQLKATYIVNLDNYIPFLKTKSIQYFDDIIQRSETDPETFIVTVYYESITIENDTLRCSAEAMSLATENSKINNVESAITSAVNAVIQKAVYSNTERDFSGQSKDEKYIYIFEKLGYKELSLKVSSLNNLDSRG